MKYNPLHHHRRSIRLKNYDYAKPNFYFITICCQDRKHWFGEIEDSKMILNEYGRIAYDQWQEIPNRYSNVMTDAFQVMPNHVHGIIQITTTDEKRVTLGTLVGTYKSRVHMDCLAYHTPKDEYMGKIWQRNYHEHIIRDQTAYEKIANYIINNPANWKVDSFF